MISYTSLDQFAEIKHFCTTRAGGVSKGNYTSFNLSPFSGDDIVDVTRNKKIVSQRLGIHEEKIIIPFQTHETNILNIDTDFLELPQRVQIQHLQGVDALISNSLNICIGITTADCVPITFFDPIKKVIGIAHAGWRGTCGYIAAKTINAMVDRYNSSPKDIYATIGPSISAENYEVGVEVVNSFRQAGFEMDKIIVQKESRTYLDLWKANKLVLENSGILSDRIEIAGICTFENHEQFFSARRLGIKSGRILSGIMLV